MLILALFALFFYQSPSTSTGQVAALLRAKDQALLDAIATGNHQPWEEALAADAVVVDENGTVMDRAEYFRQFEPLPAGVSGNIHIASFDAKVSGDVATVIHTDDEQENFHGQPLTSRYLMTETWQRTGSDWKLRLLHVYVTLQDPPAITLPHDWLAQYAGTYTAGSELKYVIRLDGDKLLGGRAGGAEKPLSAELRDVLFIAGQPRNRKIFERDASGRITGFVDRREGRDLVWHREPETAGR